MENRAEQKPQNVISISLVLKSNLPLFFSSNMYSTDTMGNLPMSEVCKKVFRGWDLGMCASGQEILF